MPIYPMLAQSLGGVVEVWRLITSLLVHVINGSVTVKRFFDIVPRILNAWKPTVAFAARKKAGSNSIEY